MGMKLISKFVFKLSLTVILTGFFLTNNDYIIVSVNLYLPKTKKRQIAEGEEARK